MVGDSLREQDQLRRFWDDVVRRAPAASDGLVPTLAETVRRLHALDDLPWPDPAFAERTWRQLHIDQGADPMAVAATAGLTMPSSGPRDENPQASELTRAGGWPGERQDSPMRRVGRFRGLRPLLELMAAVFILALIGGYATVYWLQPQVAVRWQRAAVLEAPNSGGVPMFRGDPARTGVMPGPGPDATPHVQWRVSPPSSAWRQYDRAYNLRPRSRPG